MKMKTKTNVHRACALREQESNPPEHQDFYFIFLLWVCYGVSHSVWFSMDGDLDEVFPAEDHLFKDS